MPDPRYEIKTPSQVRALRELFGLTPAAFAGRFGLPVATVDAWEAEDAVLDGPTRVLLFVIAREPEAVERAMARGVDTTF